MADEGGKTVSVPAWVMQPLATALLAAGFSTGALGISSQGTSPNDVLTEVRSMRSDIRVEMAEIRGEIGHVSSELVDLEKIVDKHHKGD